MSVVGIDPGNDTSCVALARKRGIDVLMNKESKRETPSCVNFGDKMRFLGTDGMSKMSLSPQNTVHQLKRIIGKRFNDPQVQTDIAKLPFTVKESADGGCEVEVMYCNEKTTLTAEQCMAIILVDQKHIAETEAGISVTDCVISVPTYYKEPERYAMLAAAKIAGLNCLRLINENTATALAYGIYKTDLPEDVAVNVAFVDIGHSSTQVSIVALKKSGMQVLAHAWNANAGGRDVDDALFEHFAAEFQAKTKLDVRKNKKAAFKLRCGVEKMKKILSANAEAQVNVECIMEDADLRGQMNRDQLEEICAPIFAKMRGPIDEALAASGKKASEISSIEIIGSATRTPFIFKLVEEAFGRSPSRTLNSKECVSRGCALQCAMLSPVFKVREFEVIDATPYSVEFCWEKEGAPGEMAKTMLFERNAPTPSTKMLTLNRASAFSMHAVSEGVEGPIGVWQVGPFDVPAGAEKAKLKVKVHMNLHGIVSVESIQSIEETADEPKDEKMEDAAPSGDAPAEGATPMDADAPADGPPKPAEAAPAEKKKKVKKTDVKFEASLLPLIRSPQEVESFFEKECQMQASDRLQEETNEKKNALEGYVYSLRNRLYEKLGTFASDAEKEKLFAACNEMEDWLYDEGEDVQKSVYITKLEELKAKSHAVELRSSEAEALPPAVNSLRQSVHSYMAFATSEAAQYAHIDAADKATVLKECETTLSWIDEKEALQKLQPATADPVLLSHDVIKRRDTLERVCRPIASKPAPKPAAAPKPEAAPKAEEAEAAPMDADTESGKAAESDAAAAAEEESMQL